MSVKKSKNKYDEPSKVPLVGIALCGICNSRDFTIGVIVPGFSAVCPACDKTITNGILIKCTTPSCGLACADCFSNSFLEKFHGKPH